MTLNPINLSSQFTRRRLDLGVQWLDLSHPINVSIFFRSHMYTFSVYFTVMPMYFYSFLSTMINTFIVDPSLRAIQCYSRNTVLSSTFCNITFTLNVMDCHVNPLFMDSVRIRSIHLFVWPVRQAASPGQTFRPVLHGGLVAGCGCLSVSISTCCPLILPFVIRLESNDARAQRHMVDEALDVLSPKIFVIPSQPPNPHPTQITTFIPPKRRFYRNTDTVKESFSTCWNSLLALILQKKNRSGRIVLDFSFGMCFVLSAPWMVKSSIIRKSVRSLRRFKTVRIE